MKRGDRIELILDFRLESFSQFKPSTGNATGFYCDNLNKIKKTLSVPTMEEIIKVVEVVKDISFKELERIIGITHRAMWENIERLVELKLVIKEKKKKEGERKEFKINLHPNVEIFHFFVYEAIEKKDKGKKLFRFSSSVKKDLQKMGLNPKIVVNNKNVEDIFSLYKSRVEDIINKKIKKPILE